MRLFLIIAAFYLCAMSRLAAFDTYENIYFAIYDKEPDKIYPYRIITIISVLIFLLLSIWIFTSNIWEL